MWIKRSVMLVISSPWITSLLTEWRTTNEEAACMRFKLVTWNTQKNLRIVHKNTKIFSREALSQTKAIIFTPNSLSLIIPVTCIRPKRKRWEKRLVAAGGWAGEGRRRRRRWREEEGSREQSGRGHNSRSAHWSHLSAPHRSAENSTGEVQLPRVPGCLFPYSMMRGNAGEGQRGGVCRGGRGRWRS